MEDKKKNRRATKKGRIGRWAKREGSHHEGGLKYFAIAMASKELKKLSAQSSRLAAKIHLKKIVTTGDIEMVDPNPNPFGKVGHGSWWD